MDNKKSYVYKITCKITGEFYFGSSFYAKSDYYWGSGRRIKERILKYGKDNFVKEIIGEFDDRVEAHKVENQYIEQFRHDEKCLNQMLNRHFGAYGEESCAKRSASNLGKHHTDDTKAKIGAANAISQRGKHLSKETRSKMSASHRGENFSEEHRAKIGAANLGIFRGKHWRKNPVTGKREWYD